jgi:hypothetical protein
MTYADLHKAVKKPQAEPIPIQSFAFQHGNRRNTKRSVHQSLPFDLLTNSALRPVNSSQRLTITSAYN